MKPGDIYEWLDQGPAIILDTCVIPDVFTENECYELIRTGYLDPDNWPCQKGWKVKLLITDEIIDVHANTLHSANIKKEGVCGQS